MAGDILVPAGDGTHRVIEADAIRALVGYLTQGAPEDGPALDQAEDQ